MNMGYLTKKEEVTAIIDNVCKRHNVSMRHMLQDSRRAEVVVARWEAMALVRAYTGWSYPHVGQCFGKDHTSIMYGIARHFGHSPAASGKSMKGFGDAAEAGMRVYGEQLKLEAQLIVAEAESAKVDRIRANPQWAALMGMSHAA
jgi:hypothetical protein